MHDPTITLLLTIIRTQKVHGKMLAYIMEQVTTPEDSPALIAMTAELKQSHDKLQAALDAHSTT